MQKACQTCGKLFRVKPSHFAIKTYCSRKCMSEGYKTRMAGASNPHFSDAGLKVCLWCGKEYRTYTKTSVYCSKRCYGQHKITKTQRVGPPAFCAWPKRGKPIRMCAACGAQGVKKGRSYCESCWTIGKNKRTEARNRPCCVCGKTFTATIYAPKKKTCSPECRRVWRCISQQGDKSHLWQGGKTSKAKIMRTSLWYAKWREAVYARDGYRCQMCGTGVDLNAHHVKSFSGHPELRLDVNNGITLCVECHGIVDEKAKNMIRAKRRRRTVTGITGGEA